jgi:hypothetical protein
MTGIVAALKADYQVSLLRQKVYDLAFSLITPLSPDNSHIAHMRSQNTRLQHREINTYYKVLEPVKMDAWPLDSELTL